MRLSRVQRKRSDETKTRLSYVFVIVVDSHHHQKPPLDILGMKIHKCTNVVVRVCYWPGVEEEEECSSQDPLAVYISIFLGRLFGFVCVSLSLVSTVCLSGKLYGDQSPMQCDSTHIGTAVRCVSLSCGIIVQRWCSNFFFDARRRAVFFFYYYDAASFRTTYGGQSTSGPASKSGLYPPS